MHSAGFGGNGGQFWSPMADLAEQGEEVGGGFKGLAGLGNLQQELQGNNGGRWGAS